MPLAVPTPFEPLSYDEATRLAKAAGLKAGLSVPYPVRCPSFAPVDARRFVATGALAGIVLDPDGFLHEELGIAEAASLLGTPALCNHEAGSGFSELHLGPRVANVHAATLEIYEGELIGVSLELETPVPIDIPALAKRYGTPRRSPAPMDSFEAGGEVFDVTTPAFRATLDFARRDVRDPPSARNIHEILFRRTAMIEILPDRFTSAADLARLVALALRPRAPEPVSFYGTLGVYDQTTGDHVAMLPAAAMRNVASASIEKRTRAGRDFTQSMTVTFATPIVATPEALASAIEKLVGIAAPLTMTSGQARIAIAGRGTVAAEVASGTVLSIVVERP